MIDYLTLKEDNADIIIIVIVTKAREQYNVPEKST